MFIMSVCGYRGGAHPMCLFSFRNEPGVSSTTASYDSDFCSPGKDGGKNYQKYHSLTNLVSTLFELTYYNNLMFIVDS